MITSHPSVSTVGPEVNKTPAGADAAVALLLQMGNSKFQQRAEWSDMPG